MNRTTVNWLRVEVRGKGGSCSVQDVFSGKPCLSEYFGQQGFGNFIGFVGIRNANLERFLDHELVLAAGIGTMEAKQTHLLNELSAGKRHGLI